MFAGPAAQCITSLNDRAKDMRSFLSTSCFLFLLAASVVFVLPCQAQWYPVDPFLNGYFYSVDFADDSVGVITEEYGYYRTTDRGETWEFTWFEERGRPFEVIFTLGGRGFMRMENQSLLRSDDAGESWTKTRLFELDAPVDDLDFDDAGNGIAIGPPLMIARTTDGGSTWTEITADLPSYVLEDWLEPKLFNVNVVDENTVIISGSREREPSEILLGEIGFLLRTTDGGVSWDTLSLPGSKVHLPMYFYSAESGVVCRGFYTYATTDGGKSWTETYNNSSSGERGLPSTSMFLMRPDGRLLAFGGGDSYYPRYNSVVAESFDSGFTWRRNRTNASDGYTSDLRAGMGTGDFIKDACFVDASLGFGVGDQGTVFRTTDGGVSWVRWSRPNLWGVDMVDESVGYAAGEAVLKTTDGGRTWTHALADTTYNFGALDFIDRDTGYVLAGTYNADSILKTTDGGATWRRIGDQRLVHSWSASELLSLSFPTAAVGFVRSMDSLYRTTDYGATWEGITLPFEEETWARRDYSFLADGTGFAVGADTTLGFDKRGRALYRSGDFGTTWTRVGSVSDSIESIRFIDARHGAAMHRAGSFAFTSDGGVTWRQWGPSRGQWTFNMLDFAVVDKQTAWFVGNPSRGAFYTTDGGETWGGSTLKVSTGQGWYSRVYGPYLAGVSFGGPASGLAVGYFGTIFRYDTAAPKAHCQVMYDTAGRVLFHNLSELADSAHWDFGDGSTAGTQADGTYHDYSSRGPFRVRLIVTNMFGSDTCFIDVYPRGVGSGSSGVSVERFGEDVLPEFSVLAVYRDGDARRVYYHASDRIAACTVYDALGRVVGTADVSEASVDGGVITLEGVPEGRPYFLVAEFVRGGSRSARLIF